MDLIERLEAATGPDRELDAAIALGQGWTEISYGGRPAVLMIGGSPNGGRTMVPRYTASINAALTLAKDRRAMTVFNLMQQAMGLWLQSGSDSADDLPLFICIAALRAREGEG